MNAYQLIEQIIKERTEKDMTGSYGGGGVSGWFDPNSCSSFGGRIIQSWNGRQYPAPSSFGPSTAAIDYAYGKQELHNDDYTFGVDSDLPVLDPRKDENFPFFKQAIEELCPGVTIEKTYPGVILITRPKQNWNAEELVEEAWKRVPAFTGFSGYAAQINEEPDEPSKETIGRAGFNSDGRCEVMTVGRTITFFPHTIEDYRRYAKALKIECDERDERAAVQQKLEAINKKKQAKMKAALG